MMSHNTNNNNSKIFIDDGEDFDVNDPNLFK